MVYQSFVNDNGEDACRLLEISQSDTDNELEVVHFAPIHSMYHHPPKKKRLKRKERDHLRSSGSSHNGTSSDVYRCELCCNAKLISKYFCKDTLLVSVDTWEFLRSLVLVIAVIGLTIVTLLVIHMQARLDEMETTLSAFEASGSELPAKFHESHLRLQQLEKNHSALWTSLSAVSDDLSQVSEKIKALQSNVQSLQESLAGSPKLASLPKDVANIQESVASFGSTLQDVQSTVKELKEENSLLQRTLQSNSSALASLQAYVQQLYHSVTLPLGGGREGEMKEESIASAFLTLQSRLSDLNASLASAHSLVEVGGLSNTQAMGNFYNKSLSDLLARLNELELKCALVANGGVEAQLSNITNDVSILKESSSRHYKLLQNLTQSLAVVKGVEKKLEGSQLQMASGVSELKQQLLSFEKQLKSAVPVSTAPAVPKGDIHLTNLEFVDQPRRRRSASWSGRG